ncbi:unnamed protein product [Effrenium voratum]|nr:unnamed protein product [Effrenium voratum]
MVYDICTPKIAKGFLEKLSKMEAEDASSDEAKEVLKFKDQLKAAAEGEGGDWTEAVDDGCIQIFDQLQSWEGQIKEGRVRPREIEGLVQFVEEKLGSMPKMSKFKDAVLEKAKPMVAAAKKAANDKEQYGVLSDLKFSTDLADGVIATYGMLGFTCPHFIIEGTATPVEQLESKLKKFQEGLDVDPDSELGKQLAAGIEKLKGLMPQMALICKENPRESMQEAADHKQTIALKATLMAGAAVAIKSNKEQLTKMIEKSEAALKEDGEATLFEGEAKQKILTKEQYDKALEVLKAKLKELNEKEATAKTEKAEKAEAEAKEKTEKTEKADSDAKALVSTFSPAQHDSIKVLTELEGEIRGRGGSSDSEEGCAWHILPGLSLEGIEFQLMAQPSFIGYDALTLYGSGSMQASTRVASFHRSHSLPQAMALSGTSEALLVLSALSNETNIWMKYACRPYGTQIGETWFSPVGYACVLAAFIVLGFAISLTPVYMICYCKARRHQDLIMQQSQIILRSELVRMQEQQVVACLQALPVERWREEDEVGRKRSSEECCLCLEAYKEEDMLRKLPCRHYFHQACIDKWFSANRFIPRSCPLCKCDPTLATAAANLEAGEEASPAPAAAPTRQAVTVSAGQVIGRPQQAWPA